MKAAAAVAGYSRRIQLLSAASSAERESAEVQATTFGFDARLSPRSEPISFSYFTALAAPRVEGLQQQRVVLRGEADVALVFGMVEAEPDVRADRLIIDPQAPTGATIAASIRSKANRLAIVLNRNEAAHLTGLAEPRPAARRIAKRFDAEVVVVKCGALGTLVSTPSRKQAAWLGAIPTKRVWAIGSGDVFSGVFAWHWGVRRASALDAARAASLAVSYWSEFRVLPLPRTLKQRARVARKVPQVYIAAPFFSLGQEWVVEILREALRDLGAKPFSPLHDVGRNGDGVAAKDLAAMRRCDSVIAVLDGNDPGVLLEVGYAVRAGIPVVGFAQRPDAADLKMVRGVGVEILSDLSTAVYHAIWSGM
jgi:hypothetical protein